MVTGCDPARPREGVIALRSHPRTARSIEIDQLRVVVEMMRS
ncbi:hypothetical protein X566_23785 [Afipia sp. P52-10]|nr:hypothetical protein X566_23785 [Afipia sp. P52-10]